MKALVQRNDREKKAAAAEGKPALYRIWQDDEVIACTNVSVITVKADAACPQIANAILFAAGA